MKSTAQKLPCSTCSEITESDSNVLSKMDACPRCTCANYSEVIETSGDKPWAEFCEALDQPAFLMPVTGFGDLE